MALLHSKIPPLIHIVWIGNESRRPDDHIRTWQTMNPHFQVRIWGNAELQKTRWATAHHMREMLSRDICGVADMMRWEILLHHGGFAIDADSRCIRRLDDWLFQHEAFACWENEIVRPGLISNGYVAVPSNHPLIARIVEEIQEENTLSNRMAWEATGPLRLTQTVRHLTYVNLTVFPSHFFIPRHYTGLTYTGPGLIYAEQDWSSTHAKLASRSSV